MASQVTRGRDRRLILLLRIVCFRVIHELFCSDLRVDYVKSLYKSLVMNNYMAMRQISGCTSAKIDHLSIYCEQFVSGLYLNRFAVYEVKYMSDRSLWLFMDVLNQQRLKEAILTAYCRAVVGRPHSAVTMVLQVFRFDAARIASSVVWNIGFRSLSKVSFHLCL